MKFDCLVSKILNEAVEKKTYSVLFSRLVKDKYGLKDATTTAASKDQAIGFVVSSQLNKLDRKQLGLVIWKIKNNNGAKASEKTFLPKSVKPEIKKEVPKQNGQLDLPLEAFDLEKKEGLHGWFKRNKGKGWVNCKRSRPGHIVPCGREKGTKSGKGYPACRPTLSMCSGSKAKKKGHKSIKWKKKS